MEGGLRLEGVYELFFGGWSNVTEAKLAVGGGSTVGGWSTDSAFGGGLREPNLELEGGLRELDLVNILTISAN